MNIKTITLENYRGVNKKQEIQLSNFSSIVGKNDSGKSIILNAIATFLDIKNYTVVDFDFYDSSKPIFLECKFEDDNLVELLESNIKGKIKKEDGLKEFINDIILDDTLIIQKTILQSGKKFQEENILMNDFDNKDFSMLYSKNDDELNQILDKYNIPLPIKGKGRNSKLEKIKYIKKFCFENDIPRTIRPISDEYNVISILPAVELFVSDYGLKADTSFKTTSVSEIVDYFERETVDDTKKLNLVAKEIQNEMKIEAEDIRRYMLEYTSSLQKIEITPNIVWKDAIKSVDVKFQLSGDSKPIPMTHKGSGYRRLFMVARFRYLAEKKKGSNIIYLLEEPETFLHPSAQEDLLDSFKNLCEDNQIIVTTHSPVVVGSTNYKAVVLSKKDGQIIYENATYGNKNEFVTQIVDELGIKPAYNLRDEYEKIIFVEGKYDRKFYNIICAKVLNTDFLNNEKILVLPGGGEDIESFVNIDYFSKSGRDLYLIIDSDKHLGKENTQQQKVTDFNGEKRKGYMLFKSCIENYYHPRAFERVYSLSPNTFDYFGEDENVRKTIKDVVLRESLTNIKEKNNLEIFNATTTDEWKEIVETELIDLLTEITN